MNQYDKILQSLMKWDHAITLKSKISKIPYLCHNVHTYVGVYYISMCVCVCRRFLASNRTQNQGQSCLGPPRNSCNGCSPIRRNHSNLLDLFCSHRRNRSSQIGAKVFFRLAHTLPNSKMSTTTLSNFEKTSLFPKPEQT
jgi:hypothetical protein